VAIILVTQMQRDRTLMALLRHKAKESYNSQTNF